MKNFLKLILNIVLLLSLLVVLHKCVYSNVKTHEQLIDTLSEELGGNQDKSTIVTYAGEFNKGKDALLWFVIQDGSFVDYRAVACELLANNRYRIKKIVLPSTYAKDIVFATWRAESIFLINNTNCQTIIIENQSGVILYQISISSNAYPYIYHHVPPTGETITSFLDLNGNEIQ